MAALEPVQHIRDMLYQHDCVIVPGFGGFVTNERSARADTSTNSFHPPKREVGFNARLDHNDGVLISYLSSRLAVNYVDAKRLTESFVRDVKRRLEAGKSVHFDGIGQFSLDKKKILQFDPDPSANFLTDAYGLSFFRFPALAAPESLTRRLQESSSSSLRGRARKLLRYAAIGIPLVAALTWGAMNMNVIKEYTFELSSLNPFKAVVDSGITISAPAGHSASPFEGTLREMSSLRKALMYEEKTGPAVSPASEPDIPEAAVTVESAGPAVTHYLVAGSFRSRHNAHVLHGKLQSEGFHCEVIESEKGMYRVSLFATHDRVEALNMLREMRAGKNSHDIWLLSKKHDQAR